MTMAQLWGGRFTKQTDQLVFDFNASITFDKRLFHEDVTGSIVHATMLAKQGILTEEERKSIIEGLTGILEDVDAGKLTIDETQEDIHSFVEATLIDRIGDAGKKLHTGRSRNDQVALDMRLSTRARVAETDGLTTMKGLPLAYNKDMQEDKEMAFDAMDTAADCIALFTGMIKTMKFRKDRMAKSAMNGFTNATDAADYLVGKGVPFRDAHGIIGRLVLYCIEKDTSIDALSLEELRSISDKFDEDIYDAISLKTCVEKRLTIGAPGAEMMKQVIEKNKEYLKNDAIEEYQQSLEDRLS